MITGLFIYNQKGEVLISKLFREGIKRNVSEVFRIQVIASNENSTNIKSPILTLGSTTFMYIRHKSLWLVAVTRSNVDASLVLEFLYNFVDLLKELFLDDPTNPASYLTESTIKDNFSVIYEILELSVDFGYVQTLSADNLRTSLIAPITKSSKKAEPVPLSSTTGLKGRASAFKRRTISESSNKLRSMISLAGTSSTNKLNGNGKAISPVNGSGLPWRKPGITYKKDEIYLDVIEEFNLLISSDGNTLKSVVEGTIKINSKLSGMPVCSLKLANAPSDDYGLTEDESENPFTSSDSGANSFLIKNCNFHQCVNLQETDQFENTISFIPPDGVCDLAKFRIENPPHLPFVIVHTVDDSDPNRVVYEVELCSKFPKSVKAEGVTLRIPIPLVDSKDVKLHSDGGGKLKVVNNEIQWTFKKFLGKNIVRMGAVVETQNSKLAESFQKTTSPLSVTFQIEGYSSSGWRLAYLHVESEDKGRIMKWVKYSTKSKGYDFRM